LEAKRPDLLAGLDHTVFTPIFNGELWHRTRSVKGTKITFNDRWMDR